MRKLTLSLLFLASALAEEGIPILPIDEDDLFGQDTVETAPEKKSPSLKERPPRFHFGGEIYNYNIYRVLRDVAIEGRSARDNEFFSSIVGDFYLDVRLTHGLKGYVSTTVAYLPSEGADELFIQLNEFFLDVNIRYRIFFRVGKQVLQWGTGFFWNPSDLINIDRKQFTDIERLRSGIYGFKVHLPVRTVFNLYGFLGTRDIEEKDSYSFSLKLEFLIRSFEFSLSGWFQNRRKPILAGDFSTGVSGWNFYGEFIYAAEHTRESYQRAPSEEERYVKRRIQEHTGKALFGWHKSFRQDRIFLGNEFYYTSEGYRNNVFKNDTLRMAIQRDGYYPFDHSQWYGAVFLTFDRLFRQTSSFVINMLFNLNDGSIVINPWLNVSLVNQFRFSFRPIFWIGNGSDTEATFQNNFMDWGFELSLSF